MLRKTCSSKILGQTKTWFVEALTNFALEVMFQFTETEVWPYFPSHYLQSWMLCFINFGDSNMMKSSKSRERNEWIKKTKLSTRGWKLKVCLMFVLAEITNSFEIHIRTQFKHCLCHTDITFLEKDLSKN